MTPDLRAVVRVTQRARAGLGSKRLWTYRFQVRLDNRDLQPWQVMGWHWEVVDPSGQISFLDGDSLDGQQPTLLPGQAFVYQPSLALDAGGGHGYGYYLVQSDLGEQEQVLVPVFALAVTDAKPSDSAHSAD